MEQIIVIILIVLVFVARLLFGAKKQMPTASTTLPKPAVPRTLEDIFKEMERSMNLPQEVEVDEEQEETGVPRHFSYENIEEEENADLETIETPEQYYFDEVAHNTEVSKQIEKEEKLSEPEKEAPGFVFNARDAVIYSTILEKRY